MTFYGNIRIIFLIILKSALHYAVVLYKIFAKHRDLHEGETESSIRDS